MPLVTAEAAALVRRLCEEVGFTPPGDEPGALYDWLSVLDSPLAPRGSAFWAEGHARLIEAFEAAFAGAEALCRDRLVAARELVRAHGNRFCGCSPLPPLVLDPTTRRPLCMRCHFRRR